MDKVEKYGLCEQCALHVCPENMGKREREREVCDLYDFLENTSVREGEKSHV